MFRKKVTSAEDERHVEAELNELKGIAAATSVAELRDGTWFSSLLRHAMATYTREVNADFFQRKYPGLPADAVADRRIELAQRYAMIEGGVTASAYTLAVAATIGTVGGASPLTIPGAVATFAVDLLYVTRLQLRLAFDLAVLFRHPIDIDDPEDLYDLLRVAFGVKAGEALRATVPRLAPEATRQGVKAVVKGPVLALLQSLPKIGKYLLQRNIIKFAVPAIGIPISMKLNHYLTGQTGKQARGIFRDKAAIQEGVDHITHRLEAFPSLLLRAVWLVVSADGKIEAEESWLLKALVEKLSTDLSGAGAVTEFSAMVNFDKAAFYEDLAALPEDLRADLYDVASMAAVVDHDLHSDEVTALRELASKCDVVFDLAAVKARAKRANFVGASA